MTSKSTPDKVAVVTGASSGIGAASARALAADGYRVALLARRLDRITTLANELGNGSAAIEADFTDRDSIVAAADRVRRELGTVSVLINNAGVMLLGPFDSGQRADYRQMIEVNLLGAITATECSSTSSRTAAATSSTSRRSPGELPDQATASTPSPSGASTAGPSH
jgi:NADP-dependent 3-hydroxy acid dehydrogenase YdfG